jgi:hypothetical protein
MMVVHRDRLAPIRELLGTSGLKEGAMVAVGEKSPQGKTEKLVGR